MKIDMISKSNYYFPFIWSLGGGEALQRRLGREQKLVDGREVREPSTAEPSCEDSMDCMDCILCVHLCYLFLAKRETEMKFRWKNVLPTFPTSPVFLFHQVLSFFLPWFGAAFDTFVFGDSTDLGCLRGASSPLGSSHATDADGRSHAYPPVSSGLPTSPN